MGSFAFLWAPITLIIVSYKRFSIYTQDPFRILFLYGVIMVGILQYTLWKYLNDWTRIRILYEFYYLVVATAIWKFYISKGDFKKLALIGKWAFIFLLITLVTTNIALFFDPTLVRESARTDSFTPFQNRLFNLTGTLGYSSLQALICIIPILVYNIKRRQKMVFSRSLLIIILIFVLVTEMRAQVFANILVTILITMLSLFGSRRKHVSVIAISLTLVIFMIIPVSFYRDVLISLSSNFDKNSEIYYKLTDFNKFIENPEFDTSTGTGNRAARYPILYEELLKKPLFGYASYDSNLNRMAVAHLYLMNRLTLWGIPGFFFFIYVLYRIFTNINSKFDRGFKYFYFLSILSVIFLGLIKVVGGSEPWLMLIVVIPGLYYLPFFEQRKIRASNVMNGKLPVYIKNKPSSFEAKGL